MKRMMLLGTCLLLPFLGCVAAEQPEPMTTTTTRQIVAAEVNIKIDPLPEELIKTGLTDAMVKDAMVNQLQAGSISVNEAIPQPTLTVRIRTITVGLDLATFVQMSFQEEAMLVRNRSMFLAPTWSQISLISCRPEDVKKEVLDAVEKMSQTFASDFIKALQPAG